MSPNKLSFLPPPVHGVAARGKTSSSPLDRYALLDFDWREGERGSCYGSGDSSGNGGSDGMALSCGDFESDLVVEVNDFVNDAYTAKFVLRLEAMLETIDAESASQGDTEEGREQSRLLPLIFLRDRRSRRRLFLASLLTLG